MKKQGSSVGQRWLTAIVAMPIVLLFAWFGGWAAFALTFFVMLLVTFELHAMFRHANHRPITWLLLATNIVFIVSSMFPSVQLQILEIGLAGSLFLSFVALFFRKSLEGSLVDWALTLATSIYVGFTMSFLTPLRGFESGRIGFSGGFSLFIPHGLWWLLVVFLGVWGFDAAAFFSGRYFGRHKLAPIVSPAKTWEGVLGGLVFSILACLLVTVPALGVPWFLAVLLGILIGFAATIGDLAESVLKRQSGVKDSGQFMPGHGGMLDRVDSLMFVLVVVYLFSLLFIK